MNDFINSISEHDLDSINNSPWFAYPGKGTAIYLHNNITWECSTRENVEAAIVYLKSLGKVRWQASNPPKPPKPKTISDFVEESQDDLRKMTHVELYHWAVNNPNIIPADSKQNANRFNKFKNALKRIGIDYDKLKNQGTSLG